MNLLLSWEFIGKSIELGGGNVRGEKSEWATDIDRQTRNKQTKFAITNRFLVDLTAISDTGLRVNVCGIDHHPADCKSNLINSFIAQIKNVILRVTESNSKYNTRHMSLSIAKNVPEFEWSLVMLAIIVTRWSKRLPASFSYPARHSYAIR